MASDFWLVAGLGNPGKKYEGTRHNLGFDCLDELAVRWSASLRDHKGLALLGKSMISLDSQRFPVFLCKPLTFMNDSGAAVASICEYYDIDAKRVIVIHDDMDLDFGRIKVKVGGSAGGHNGIRSIDKSLGTNGYARVRLGTGHADRGANAHAQSIDWVLGRFSSAQRSQMQDFMADGADAVEMIISRGLTATQEKFNGR
jgi:PTH1 family peptidyl-tRNA hydrolase